LHWALYRNATTPTNSPPYGGQSVIPEPLIGAQSYEHIARDQQLRSAHLAAVSPGSVSTPARAGGTVLDLIFVIDTTNSMRDDIDAAKASATEIINSIESRVTDYRIALVEYRDFPNPPYGDPGDFPSKTVLPFTKDKSRVIGAINSLRVAGGGDPPEAVYSALRHAILDPSVGGWRNGASKIVILMGDAPPHDPEPFTNYRLKDVVDAANSVDPAVIHAIAILGEPAVRETFSTISAATAGKLFTAANAGEVVPAITAALAEATNPTPSGGSGAIFLLLTVLGAIGVGVGIASGHLQPASRGNLGSLRVSTPGQPSRIVAMQRLPFTIGRGPSCSLRLADPRVSWVHARISLQQGGPVLEDLGSVNGSFLNGQRLRRFALRPNCLVKIGSTEISFLPASLLVHAAGNRARSFSRAAAR
jgi:hypothetical protein